MLFLAIDDLNDWIGALGGHPQARTPNLDRLISKGILFSNAHCAAPVCGASRHALLSGLRPSTTGWYTNSSKKRADYEKALGETVPMPTHFKGNGYKTMAAGKIFHKGTSDVKGYDYWACWWDGSRSSRAEFTGSSVCCGSGGWAVGPGFESLTAHP